MSKKQYTSHDDVNAILETLLNDVKEVLGVQFVGMYLFGSLANGDFDKDSDIDILVVTNNEITETGFSALNAMHKRVAAVDSPWATQLEVSFIPKNALRRFDPAHKLHPHIDRGRGEELHMMLHEQDWIIQRYILYESGITLEGPAPQSMIDPISRSNLQQAMVDVLRLWVMPILKDPSQHLTHRGYQSFIVLSLCRMLYTIQNGTIASKSVAAQWTQTSLGNKWTSLIERAIVGRQNPGLETQHEDVSGTLDLIRFMLDYVEQYEKEHSAYQVA